MLGGFGRVEISKIHPKTDTVPNSLGSSSFGKRDAHKNWSIVISD